jgi:delta24(24(1))-sterol reductase
MSVRQRKPTNGEAAPKPSTTVSRIYAPTEHGRLIDAKLDSHTSWEFGGPWGVTAMMLGFPVMMYYLWICLWFYHGQFARPSALAWEGKGGVAEFLGTMWGYVKNVSQRYPECMYAKLA